MENTLIIILGPTGIGKTNLAIEIAQYFNTEILSADSRQIYKELKIGTAVPSAEQLKTVAHHFIQTKSIHEYYNASMYELEVIELLNTLFQKYKVVLMTGGSGMYIDAVCYGIDDIPSVDEEVRNNLIHRLNTEGLESIRKELKIIDPQFYSMVDLKNPKRILKALEIYYVSGKPYSSFLTRESKKRDFNIIKIGLELNRKELYDRINKRVEEMVNLGLIEEAKELHKYKELNALNTVGYKELFDYFEGKHSLQEAIEIIKRNTRHYARKQITWFNRYTDIKWFKPFEKDKILDELSIQLK